MLPRGNDGTATAIVNGGTPSYTYLWTHAAWNNSPVASGLTAGSYTCTVTDI